MKIDITSLYVERSSDTHIRIGLTKPNTEYSEHASFFCISNKEWVLARACMLGIAEVYPYFDDGLYGLKFFPDGMRVMYSDKREMDYFTFPCNELVPYIDYVFDASNLDPEWRDNSEFLKKNDYTNDLDKWQIEYGPKVQVFIEEDVKERLLQDICHPKLKEPAKNLIDDLTQWASRYSDGNLIGVHIFFDDMWGMKQNPDDPTSYYWYLWDEERQVCIVNGGFIAHRYEQKDGTVLFQYSMHT